MEALAAIIALLSLFNPLCLLPIIPVILMIYKLTISSQTQKNEAAKTREETTKLQKNMVEMEQKMATDIENLHWGDETLQHDIDDLEAMLQAHIRLDNEGLEQQIDVLELGVEQLTKQIEQLKGTIDGALAL